MTFCNGVRTKAASEWPLHRDGRLAVLVDIENVVGGVVTTADQARWVADEIQRVVGLGPEDHIVIGTGTRGAFPTIYGWPFAKPRILVRDGANGADIVLDRVLAQEHLDQRFDEIVVVSGDHFFAASVDRLVKAGKSVTVVAWPTGLAPVLREAATRVLHLGAPQTVEVAA